MRKIRKRFTPEARALIRRLPPGVKTPLRALTDEIANDPDLGKPLQRELAGFRSARHTHYRVIYEYQEKDGFVTIHYLGKRDNIYSLFEKLLEKRR